MREFFLDSVFAISLRNRPSVGNSLTISLLLCCSITEIMIPPRSNDITTRWWWNSGQLQGPGRQWSFDSLNCPRNQRGVGGNLRCLGDASVPSPILLCCVRRRFLLPPPLAQLKNPALEGAFPMILPPSPPHHHHSPLLVLLLLLLHLLHSLPARSCLLSHSNSTSLWHNSELGQQHPVSRKERCGLHSLPRRLLRAH